MVDNLLQCLLKTLEPSLLKEHFSISINNYNKDFHFYPVHNFGKFVSYGRSQELYLSTGEGGGVTERLQYLIVKTEQNV